MQIIIRYYSNTVKNVTVGRKLFKKRVFLFNALMCIILLVKCILSLVFDDFKFNSKLIQSSDGSLLNIMCTTYTLLKARFVITLQKVQRCPMNKGLYQKESINSR